MTLRKGGGGGGGGNKGISPRGKRERGGRRARKRRLKERKTKQDEWENVQEGEEGGGQGDQETDDESLHAVYVEATAESSTSGSKCKGMGVDEEEQTVGSSLALKWFGASACGCQKDGVEV